MEIPGPGGGIQPPGIATVVVRLVQRAVLHLAAPTPTRVELRVRTRVECPPIAGEGLGHPAGRRAIGVEVDPERCFNRIADDVRPDRVNRRIAGRCLLRLVRRFPGSGSMRLAVVAERPEGTPEGGPPAPLSADPSRTGGWSDGAPGSACRPTTGMCRCVGRRGQRAMASVPHFAGRRRRLRVSRPDSAAAHIR